MVGGSKPRRKGDNFERRVKKHLQELGFFCVRQPRSAFPDLIAIRDYMDFTEVYFIECKMNKYISKEERTELNRLSKKFMIIPLIAYSDEREIRFCNLGYGKFTF